MGNCPSDLLSCRNRFKWVCLARDTLYIRCQKVLKQWNVFGNFYKTAQIWAHLSISLRWALHTQLQQEKKDKLKPRRCWYVEYLSSTQGLSRHPHMTGIFSHVAFFFLYRYKHCEMSNGSILKHFWSENRLLNSAMILTFIMARKKGLGCFHIAIFCLAISLLVKYTKLRRNDTESPSVAVLFFLSHCSRIWRECHE